MGWEQAASGYAGVWATENTREAIFDAMKRKETYATTGPRMIVRFFGGWDFAAADAATRLPADVGYAKGVPMGGDLRRAPTGKSPTFLVGRDEGPDWRQPRSRSRSSRAGSTRRARARRRSTTSPGPTTASRAPNGKLPAVGNTVDVANATWTNTIGSSELITVWKDPDFDPTLRAVYYARVIEIPTPRWTAYDAKRFGIRCAAEVPMVDPGARLHLADLVHALRPGRRRAT